MAALHRAAVAFGSNLGDRLANIQAALRALEQLNIKVACLSRLYESAPAYVTDQPHFLNGAALVETALPPLQLLHSLKGVEARLGRELGPGAQRYGPRPIDLDIIFYEGQEVAEGEQLLVPHPRWRERDFVVGPLADLAPPLLPPPAVPAAAAAAAQGGVESAPGGSMPGGLQGRLHQAAALWEASGGERRLCTPALECVMPMGRLGLWHWQRRTQVMGILNVTPDSFSDGGSHISVAAAAETAKRMAAAGADIIDVGGQSTRPGSELLSAGEEAARVVPVLRALAAEAATAALPLSVDTFYAEVAAAAVEAGATMVNDVSGGSLDPGMLPQVAALGVPYVLMHMRGSPQTMQQREHTSYGDLVAEVAAELAATSARALEAGVQPWSLVLDPGLGFAKTAEGSLALVGLLGQLRRRLPPPLSRLPLLLGPSRKGFLGKATGRAVPAERDYASAAAAALCVAGGAAIIRAHNVAATRDAVRVADAVARAAAAAGSGSRPATVGV